MDASFFHVTLQSINKQNTSVFFALISVFSNEMINNTREENKPLKTDLNHDINDNLMKRIIKLEDMTNSGRGNKRYTTINNR